MEIHVRQILEFDRRRFALVQDFLIDPLARGVDRPVEEDNRSDFELGDILVADRRPQFHLFQFVCAFTH